MQLAKKCLGWGVIASAAAVVWNLSVVRPPPPPPPPPPPFPRASNASSGLLILVTLLLVQKCRLSEVLCARTYAGYIAYVTTRPRESHHEGVIAENNDKLPCKEDSPQQGESMCLGDIQR